MTQQNSALVEQSAAAARRLADQADGSGELMAFFRLAHGAGARAAAATAPGAERPARRRPA